MLSNRGVIYEVLGDDISALQNYNAAILCSPTNFLARFNSGNLFLKQRAWEKAIDFYQSALQLDLNNIPCHVNIAIAHTMMKKYDLAMSYLDRAIDLDPTLPQVRYCRAVIFSTLENHSEADLELSHIIARNPRDSSAYLERSVIRGKDRRLPEALDDYSRYLSLAE
jgi:tetratricopeptide (TPR) repeat protein